LVSTNSQFDARQSSNLLSLVSQHECAVTSFNSLVSRDCTHTNL